jgi:hypothetical protein
MQQITVFIDLQDQLNMFRTNICPSSGAWNCKLQHVVWCVVVVVGWRSGGRQRGTMCSVWRKLLWWVGSQEGGSVVQPTTTTAHHTTCCNLQPYAPDDGQMFVRNRLSWSWRSINTVICCIQLVLILLNLLLFSEGSGDGGRGTGDGRRGRWMGDGVVNLVLIPRILSVVRLPNRKLRDFPLFRVSPSFQNCPSPPWAPLRQISVCSDSDVSRRQSVTLCQTECYVQFHIVRHLLKYCITSGVPRNFIRGGFQQIQLRTEITGIWGQWPPSQGFWRQL